MICEAGRVVSIENDWVWVETHQTTACKSCSAKAGCGQSLINSVFSGKRHYVKVAANGIKDKVHLHDEVEIAIPENVMLRGSFLLYLLPLAGLIAGAIMGQHFISAQGDLGSIAGAIAGFSITAVFIRWHSHRNSANPAYQPVLHRIVRSASLSTQPVVLHI
jgi:sigma-E factor negative regulatory protein RseC